VIDPAELITQARTWLGVPFRHQGRGRAGVDCAGFLVALMEAAGELPRDYHEPANYGRMPARELIDVVRRYCVPAARAPTFPGALVLMRWPRDRQPSHVGLCTGATLIHCYQREGGVVEHGYRGPWPRVTHSLWRMPGVRYE
jgi:cell wall-associated NlpC family hydrolase